MRSAVLSPFVYGWLFPLLVTALFYFGAFEYEKSNSRDGWGAFGLFAIAPRFFAVVGILNLWVFGLRGRRKRVVFPFGLALPMVALILLVAL
jgi:hypothetical protein